jgi:hypothetical protein
VIRDYEFGDTRYSAAARCTCPRGEALRQLDRAQESQELVKGAAKKGQTAFMPVIAISGEYGAINMP